MSGGGAATAEGVADSVGVGVRVGVVIDDGDGLTFGAAALSVRPQARAASATTAKARRSMISA
jgi:hypothetical protein